MLYAPSELRGEVPPAPQNHRGGVEMGGVSLQIPPEKEHDDTPKTTVLRLY